MPIQMGFQPTLISRMWRPRVKASGLISAYMTGFATNHPIWWRVASLPRGTFFYFQRRETGPCCYTVRKLVQRWKHKALTTLYTCLLIFLLRRRGWRGVPPSPGWESSRKTTKMSCNRYKMVVKCAFGTFFSPGQSSRTTFSKKIRGRWK